MIDRFEITRITHRYNIVYVSARNLDNTSQSVCITMPQLRFESYGDRQLSDKIIEALNHRYPPTTYGEVSIMQTEVEDIEDVIKSRINNMMSSLQSRFTSDVTSGTAPLTVIFADQSYGVPTSWSWDFGDGDTSSSQNPAHTYLTPGTYTVSLTVTRSTSSHTETKTSFITVT